MSEKKILVVDDEHLIRWSFEKELSREGYEVFTAASGEEGLEIFERERPDLVILDIKLPGVSGMDVLQEIKKEDPHTPVLMITAYADVKTAVEAMKLGAVDYLSKPFNFEEVKLVISRCLNQSRIQREYESIKEKELKTYDFSNIVHVSEKMKKLLQLAKKVAESNAPTILIEGESGTGKDLLSRAIHYTSSRKNFPFMEINCAAIPETLVESELFGYEKGAFTDARMTKKGLFELANGGTVFLDEISELPLFSQAKLLRVLETKTFKRLGGTKDIRVDIRVIATTNRNLLEEVKKGRFREDLYFRLNVVELKIPPLRERREDIPVLVNYFIKNFNREFRKKIKGITSDALKALMNYHWPGNVRELKNAIERAVILSEGEYITLDDISFVLQNTEKRKSGLSIDIPPEGISLENVEKELILKALEITDWNKSKAAKLLSISRDTLKYRMKKYGIEDKNHTGGEE